MYVNPFHKSKYLFIHFEKNFDAFIDELAKKFYLKKTLSFKTLSQRSHIKYFRSDSQVDRILLF